MVTSDNIKNENCGFSKPALYKIKVLGKLPSTFTTRLPYIDISFQEIEYEGVTILIGRLKDQSALSGVLNSLFDMHLTILQVKMMKEKF